MAEEESKPPCLLELYLEMEDQTDDQCGDVTEEENEKYLETVSKNLDADLVELLNKYVQGHKGVSLVHTLRAAHLAMSGQLGLVEGWLLQELHDAGVEIDPQVVHAERGEGLQSGFDHAHHHLCKVHDHGDPHGGDDEPVVH